MGLKIQNSSFPPIKLIISKKMHILRPAIDCLQQVSKPRKVRTGDWDPHGTLILMCSFPLVCQTVGLQQFLFTNAINLKDPKLGFFFFS